MQEASSNGTWKEKPGGGFLAYTQDCIIIWHSHRMEPTMLFGLVRRTGIAHVGITNEEVSLLCLLASLTEARKKKKYLYDAEKEIGEAMP